MKISLATKANKDVFRYTKAGRIHYQQIYTLRNVKRRPLDKRKIISDENMDLHKGSKIIRNSNTMSKYVDFFLII